MLAQGISDGCHQKFSPIGCIVTLCSSSIASSLSVIVLILAWTRFQIPHPKSHYVLTSFLCTRLPIELIYSFLSAVLNALFNCLREAHARRDIKAIVVTGSNNRFSAGFDIAEFAKQSGGGGIDSRCVPTSGHWGDCACHNTWYII